MSKLRELAIVNVKVYQQGQRMLDVELLELENEIWGFADPKMTTVWDALVDEDAAVATFATDALCIQIEPVPTPWPRWNGMSYLESFLSVTPLDAAFSDTDALVWTAKRRLLDGCTRLSGLFEVEFPDGDDRRLEAEQIRASFLGELDFNQSLSSLTFTVTTAELEARVLAAMRAYRVPMSVELIADAVNVRHDLINAPVLALDHAGLIVSNYTGNRLVFSLTDRAKKGIL